MLTGWPVRRAQNAYTRHMLDAWRGVAAKVRGLFRLVVLFCILRFVVGFAMIVLVDRNAIAFGPELTAIVAAMVVVYVGVALAVRRWSPPRRGETSLR